MNSQQRVIFFETFCDDLNLSSCEAVIWKVHVYQASICLEACLPCLSRVEQYGKLLARRLSRGFQLLLLLFDKEVPQFLLCLLWIGTRFLTLDLIYFCHLYFYFFLDLFVKAASGPTHVAIGNIKNLHGLVLTQRFGNLRTTFCP